MKLPKKLKIGAHIFNVQYEAPNNLGNDRDGYYDARTNTLTINNTYSEVQQFSILMHEILHAINGEVSEREVEFYAQALTQVLVDNNLLK